MGDTIVLYPCPGRGHLVSMVELGRLLLTHHPHFSIAIIIPAVLFESSSSNDYIDSVSAATPSITFYHLPPVPTSGNFSSPSDFATQIYELVQLNNPSLRQTLLTISKLSNLKAFVIDFFCNASFQVSSSLNIPTYYYFTTSVSGLASLIYFPTIHKNTTKSLKELNDMLFNCPGLPPLSAKEMPEPMLDRESKVYQCFLDTANQMRKSAGVIVNSFELLEERALKALVDGHCAPGESTPAVYCIGPVIGEVSKADEDKHECLTWLDSQPTRSVVFLCFGSMGVLHTNQLKEIAIGLERSGVRFLWVVRTPPPHDETRRMLSVSDPNPSIELFLPEGFLDRTRDRGFIVKSWAPQMEILSHDSVGGFVTHCGWNSVLESVCAGVPMLAWPLYAEQKMNKVFLVEEMNVAMPMATSEDGLVSATELEKRVTELLDSEKGEAVRERVMAMKEGAAAAMRDGGSSLVALAKLAESFRKG